MELTRVQDTEEEEESEYGPYADEDEALEAFDNTLNACYDVIKVCGYEYDPSRALKELDPIAYREEFNNWLDSEIYSR